MEATERRPPPGPSRCGAANPNWRGGGIDKTCHECGRVFLVPRAWLERRRYCNRKCTAAAQSRLRIGESHPNWKGGGRESKRRYREKQREKQAPKQGEKRVAKPRARATRICPLCRKPGVPKGRKFHAECSPIGKCQVPFTCIGCGLTKMIPRGRANQRRCRDCDLAARAGAGNANWQGGITPANKKARKLPDYTAWRTRVFQRDAYTCVECGQRGGTLHADHIKPFAYYPDLRFDVSNGRTLCVSCHEKTDTYLGRAKAHKPQATEPTP